MLNFSECQKIFLSCGLTLEVTMLSFSQVTECFLAVNVFQNPCVVCCFFFTDDGGMSHSCAPGNRKVKCVCMFYLENVS